MEYVPKGGIFGRGKYKAELGRAGRGVQGHYISLLMQAGPWPPAQGAEPWPLEQGSREATAINGGPLDLLTLLLPTS